MTTESEPPAAEPSASEPQTPATGSDPQASDERRLHAAAVALETAGSLRELLLPLGALIVFGASSGSPMRAIGLAVVGFVVALTMGIARWATTTYRITPDRIVLRMGLLSPDEQLVPRARISSVDIVQGPLQRALGVVELHVQAAGGGGKAEIVLKALSPEDARNVREELGHPQRATAPDALWRLSPRALVTTALTAPHAGVLVPVAAGLGALLQELSQVGSEDSLRESVPDDPQTILLAVLGLALALALLTIVAAVFAFGGFEVRREGRLLRLRRGLLQRRAATIPLSRVHGVRIIENPLRQLLGLAAVRIETVAHGGQPAAAQTLLPLVRRNDLAALLGELLPNLVLPGGSLNRPPARARRRYALPPTVLGLIAGGAIALPLPGAWPAVPVLTLLGALVGLLRFADAGWALEESSVAIRSRRLSRTTLVARSARLQLAELQASVLQRRAALATAGIAVGAGRRAQVAHLEEREAASLFERLRVAAETYNVSSPSRRAATGIPEPSERPRAP